MAIKCKIVSEFLRKEISKRKGLFIGEVSWNGREPRGVDIRECDNDEGTLFKGITIPYEIWDEFVGEVSKVDLENMIDMIDIEKIEQEEEKYIPFDFNKMFSRVDEENKFTRDKFGRLMDKCNKVVVIRNY